MALFVVMRDAGSTVAGIGAKGSALEGDAAGRASLDTSGMAATGVPSDLRRRLLDAIRTKLSARHVPDEVFAVPEVPRTLSGKKMEVPVKKILLGHPVEKSVNRDSMANRDSIEWFLAFARARG
jgi:acetoacetyl-CoA synthetase